MIRRFVIELEDTLKGYDEDVETLETKYGAEERPEERPTDDWYNYISKNLLRDRHGDYIVYRVDYLLDHLAREITYLQWLKGLEEKREADNDKTN